MIDFKAALEQAKNIISKPNSFWIAYTASCPSEQEVRYSFVVPFLTVAFLADFTGALFFSSRGMQEAYAIVRATATLSMLAADLYLCSWFLSKIFESYGYGKAFNKSYTIIAYSSVPSWIATIILSLFPNFIIIWFFSFYSFYLMWQGIKTVYNPHQEHRSGILLATIAAIIIIGILIQVLALKALEIMYTSNAESLL